MQLGSADVGQQRGRKNPKGGKPCKPLGEKEIQTNTLSNTEYGKKEEAQQVERTAKKATESTCTTTTAARRPEGGA
jgi:hypothetical protein